VGLSRLAGGRDSCGLSSASGGRTARGALARIRTWDTRFRKPVLYPLSYEGGIGWNRGWRAMDCGPMLRVVADLELIAGLARRLLGAVEPMLRLA
jgi:hypothetical protein